MFRKDNTIEAAEQENVPKFDFFSVFIALISQISAHYGCFAYRSQPYFMPTSNPDSRSVKTSDGLRRHCAGRRTPVLYGPFTPYLRCTLNTTPHEK